MVVTPFSHGKEKKCTFGATSTRIDLNDISDEELETLRAATHKFQFVCVKNQYDLDPVKHWELISKLDPTAPQVHGHGTVEQFQKTGVILPVSRSCHYQPLVRVLTLLRQEPPLGYPQQLM